MKATDKQVKFLALIAYKHGEISIGLCRDLTGWDDTKIKDEMLIRCGKEIPEKNI